VRAVFFFFFNKKSFYIIESLLFIFFLFFSSRKDKSFINGSLPKTEEDIEGSIDYPLNSISATESEMGGGILLWI
jgi:hypothetical protein